jgi:asparagine synthase (glutamine-hydrolysing)
MCGIVGVYHFDRDFTVRESDLVAMADAIVHRGPDDSGYYVRGNVGLAMRRLSIIDLAGGHQPIFTADKSKAIVFNGELYNYREQARTLDARGYVRSTNSDTEVTLGLYNEFGIGSLDRLNGMFGFAIHDQATNQLHIVRDRIGIKPLYYYRDGEKIVFASEIKAILKYPGVRASLDTDSLPAYFKYGFTPAPRTLFAGISKLPPAHRMQIHGDTVKIERYWQVSFADKFRLTEAALLEQLDELLSNAVELQMIADVPLGAFLSGGLDSSGIVHLMRENGADPIKTYSIGFENEYGMHDESADAAVFARDYATDHHAILATPDVESLIPRLVGMLDEPLADSSFVVTYLVSQLAAETVKVILSGVGGDEIFGGYRRYLFSSLDRYYRFLPSAVRERLLPALAQRIPADRNNPLLNNLRLAKSYLANGGGAPLERYTGYLSLLTNDRIDDYLVGGAAGGFEWLNAEFDASDAEHVLDQVMYFDLKHSLPEQLLMLTDKMTMAESLEARVPYLDHRLVEMLARTPPKFRVNGFRLRYLQKQYLRGRIPDYVLSRKKKGFGAPFGGWIRGRLNTMVRDYLSEDRIRSQGLFNPEVLGGAVEEHMSKREDRTDFILANLSFQIWMDEYLSGPTVAGG